MVPLCMKRKRPCWNGWLFVSCTARPGEAARMCANTREDEMANAQAGQVVAGPGGRDGPHHAREGRHLRRVPAHAEAVGVERLRHGLGAIALRDERVARPVEQVGEQDRMTLVGDEAAH